MIYKYNPEAPKDSVAEAKFDVAGQELEYVRFGLKGFKNFINLKGEEILFKTEKKKIGNTNYDVVSDETLKPIPRRVLKELAKIITKENIEQEEEAKN